VSLPFDLYSAAVFDSHVQCRSPAMPRLCRSESDLSRPWQVRGRGTAWKRLGMCELASAVQRRHVGDLPRSKLSDNGRVVAGSRQGTGMVTAWKRHGMCESTLTRNATFNNL
jgi:hypothetical protein